MSPDDLKAWIERLDDLAGMEDPLAYMEHLTGPEDDDMLRLFRLWSQQNPESGNMGERSPVG